MTVKLNAVKREQFKGSVNKSLRRNGLVPAVVYGKGKENQTVAVNSLDLQKTLRDAGRNAIISLEVESGNAVEVMLHDYQMEATRDELVHVDFYIVDMSEEMDVPVVVHLDGEPQGARDGGILQQPLFELVVRAKPNHIPDEIVVDVSALQIGEGLTVGDLPTSDKYAFVEDPETTVATVLVPTEESLEPSTGDQAEPELVGAEDDKE